MHSSIHPLVLVISFVVAQYSSNLVMNSDFAITGDGPNGYAFSPKGLAMDGNGNIVFTEVNSVRIANTSGYVTTVSSINTVPSGLFNGLSGIVVDSKGNIIVADSLNNAVKRIDINGRVSVIGNVASQSSSIVSTVATGFNYANTMAIDLNSNVFVADSGNNLVKKILPNGTLVNFASLTNPHGMALDASGNVFVGNDYNVYKITPAGSVSALAGSGSYAFADGTGASASFNQPYPAAVDGNGNVIIADYFNNRIRKVTSAGVVSTVAGSGAATSIDGQGTSASISHPEDVKFDSLGNLLVADSYGCKIRKISVSGAVTTIAGNGTCASVDGQGTSASFASPTVLALDGNGNLYVSDWSSCKIRIINSTNYVRTFAGFNGCGSIVNGNLLVAQFNNINGLAIDPNNGNIFVSESNNNAVRKIAVNLFNSPTGVAVDSLGTVFVADQKSHMIKFIDTAGVVNILAGSGNASFVNGNGIYAGFNSPYGVALDLYGNVIVTDTGNNMIRNVTRSGSVTTIAGNGMAGWVDGQGTNSLLSSPMGVSVDSSNRVFFTDSANNCVRVINSTGYVNTLFFGRGSNIALNAPQGIFVAPNGDLFIADTGNKRIRTVPASSLIGRI